MELTISETRIIIDVLEFKFAHLQEEQAKLDDSHQDKIAELSNDMYEFNYHRPGSLDEAKQLLSANSDAKVLAGGMTLLPYRIAAQAMQEVFLGDVDQVEVNCKGANYLVDRGRAQARDQPDQFLAFEFAVAFTQPDETGAQRLDRVKHFRAFMLEQNVAYQLAQQLDARA